MYVIEILSYFRPPTCKGLHTPSELERIRESSSVSNEHCSCASGI